MFQKQTCCSVMRHSCAKAYIRQDAGFHDLCVRTDAYLRSGYWIFLYVVLISRNAMSSSCTSAMLSTPCAHAFKGENRSKCLQADPIMPCARVVIPSFKDCCARILQELTGVSAELQLLCEFGVTKSKGYAKYFAD